MKPLFIPLFKTYWDQIRIGNKPFEIRQYGPRWNEQTCPPGRQVILSAGYGKKHRFTRHILRTQKIPAANYTHFLPLTPPLGSHLFFIHLTPPNSELRDAASKL